MTVSLFQDEAERLVESGVPLAKGSLEYKVVRLTADGMTQKEIAQRLGEPLDAIEDAVKCVLDEFGSALA